MINFRCLFFVIASLLSAGLSRAADRDPRSARPLEMLDDGVDPRAGAGVGEEVRRRSPDQRRVGVHPSEVGPNVRREVGLVDDQQAASDQTGAALPRDLVAPCDIDDVEALVDELGTERQREVVAAALEEDVVGAGIALFQLPEDGEPVFDNQIYYSPGNHDHHMWEGAREEMYAQVLARTRPGDALPEAPHTTAIFNPELVEVRFLTQLLRRYPQLAEASVDSNTLLP